MRGPLVEDEDPHLGPVHIQAHRLARQQRDLMALALERHRPDPAPGDLPDVGGHDALVDREASVRRQIDAHPPFAEGDLVAHQRRASSRPARAHEESAFVTARLVTRERAASTATRAAAAAAPSGRSPRSEGGQ